MNLNFVTERSKHIKKLNRRCHCEVRSNPHLWRRAGGEVFFFALLLVSIQSFTQTNNKTINVYLIGGQSNATGQGYLKNLPTDFKLNKEVIIFHSGKPHLNSGLNAFTWLPLHQASESPDRFGPELGFGNKIKELFPNNKIAIIKHAHSGTNLFKDWKPSETLNDTINWGNQFKVFVQTVIAGLDSLKQSGYNPIIKGMLWQQGEGDADAGGDTAVRYGEHLKAFITRVRNQFNCPEMLFIYGYVYPPPCLVPGSLFVRKGEFEVSENSKSQLAVKGAYVVPTDDLSLRANDKNSPYPKDIIHFGTDGTYQLGVRMAEEMAKQLNK